MDVWRTPNGKPLSLAQVFDEIREHVTNEGKVYAVSYTHLRAHET